MVLVVAVRFVTDVFLVEDVPAGGLLEMDLCDATDVRCDLLVSILLVTN